MVEDLNENHLKRPFDTNEKARLFLIQILSHQKSAKGGKKGKEKGEPREENHRGKRECGESPLTSCSNVILL